jgi:hypothetical protein
MLTNPFVIYILAFGAAVAAYALGWSDAFPPFSSESITFFGLSFAVAGLLAAATYRATSRVRIDNRRIPDWIIYPLALLFCADVAYSGFPLKKLFDGTFEYADPELGIPHVHVFAVTLGTTFSAIRFSDYLATKRWRYLFEAGVPIIYMLLLVYRGAAAICFVSWAFAYFIVKRPGLPAFAGLGAAALVGLYLFGLFGDFRQQSDQQILVLGKASDAFERSGVPRPFFWTYTYLAAPLANLQLSSDIKNLDARSTSEFIISEFLPDVLSKRLLPLVGSTNRLDTLEVSPGINVATIFGRSSVYAGWPGVAAMFGWFCLVVLVYLYLIRGSPLAVPSLALLNTLIVFCTFQNMIAHSGAFLQIVWPPLLSALLWKRNLRSEQISGTLPT